MRTITKISTQKKTTDRYNIFLDNIYAFSVSEDVFVQFNLRKGLTLSEKEIEEITANDSWHRSYIQAIHYLSYWMRSKNEMRIYLQKKEVSPTVIDEIIAKLEEEKYLNDAEFANAFVRDRMNQTTKGPVLIAKELKEKGVTAEIANNAVKQYDYEHQFETALTWAKKKQKRKTKQSYNKQNEQLKLKLTQKGFGREVVNDVFSEVKLVIDEDEELAALTFHADKLYRKYSKKYAGNDLKMRLKTSLYRRGFQRNLINEYVAKLDEEM